MIADCTALILAGGDSRRMGCDKTRLQFGGRILLQHVIDELRPVFSQVLVSVREGRNDIRVPQVRDRSTGKGPLAGLSAGLARVNTPWIFALAADMPFINPALIARLARERRDHQAVVPVIDGFPQPLTAFYARSALNEMQRTLSGGTDCSLRGLLKRLDVCWVDAEKLRAADPALRSFIDLDTPEDLAQALATKEPSLA
ncbi:molybdenum cofactor guanylyltransferase [Propionivibrio dicarboxylicus]|uniref:Molybdenum cofactor guanylyltransferase n=1 Tax=Propionivibrio dicarboxylicus TaxID=83767 RepID=A0A1G8K0J6_9RHOO|nr:molybdenum cofactor guanylyltransferase [Propionivibrio dicarboxylicus]SDI36972.1 molybdopterin-guanine dinucleotide biosynthesis protein A [Propionivibrio dicarboxylicus]